MTEAQAAIMPKETVAQFCARGGRIRVYDPRGNLVGLKTRADDYRTWEEVKEANRKLFESLGL